MEFRRGMSWSLVTVLLAIPLATAHQQFGRSRQRHLQHGKRIILSARGEARYAKEEPIAEDASRSNSNAGIVSESDDDSQGKKEYIQLVNGSTPTGWMQLGTPPKSLFVIFDTGSDKLVAKTWDTLSNELASIDQGADGLVLPSKLIYNHNSSSSYRRKFMTDPRTNAQVPAKQQIAYGSGMAITDEGNDTVKMGPFVLENFSLSEITADSLVLLHTKKGISGVLGLQHMKNRSLGRSLFSRFRDDGLMTSFGYCRGTGDNGTFIWGDTSTEGDEIPVIGDMHWAVKLGSVKMNGRGAKPPKPTRTNKGKAVVIHVGRKEDDLRQDAGADTHEPMEDDTEVDDPAAPPPCADDKCTGIFDTGSNIIAGPTSVMKALSKQASVAPDCSNYDSLPTISLRFSGKEVTVHPEGYVMKVPMPKWAAMSGHGGSGGGAAAGFDGDSEGRSDDDRNGAGLEQQQEQHGAQLGWKAVFEHLRKHRGIDLSTAMRDELDFDNASQPEFLCMPALVPIDKHTKFGPLYIIGTPLLQTHYARWSFDAHAAAPKIHIKRLSESTTCKKVDPSAASLEAIAPVSSRVMRSEQRSQHSNDISYRRGPMIRNIEDISFPHWAKHIEHL